MMFVGAALPLHSDGLAKAASHIGVDPALLWSVVTVETSGCGFLPDRRPSILFERHKFKERTGGRFDRAHPGISGRPSKDSYGKPGAYQYERLEEAMACDRRAALESASWGLGQIMGFNAAKAGFRDAEDMVAQMMRGESEQLLGMASFLKSSCRLHTALRDGNWTGFACGYNGEDYARHRYDEKLADAHKHLSKKGLPDLDARAVQLLLTYHGFDPGKIDGIVGERTRAAIAAFTTKHKLPGTSDHKDLRAALLETLPPAAAAPHAGPDLRIVQSLLEYLGWSPGPVDGKPGPRTRHAIGGFQRSCGTAATGEVDAGLLAALEETTRRGFGRNRSADTRLVQQLLAIRGFDPGGIDGLAGAKTKAAITAFAQAQGAPPADDLDTLNRLLSPKASRTI